jgi:hypothetical protein
MATTKKVTELTAANSAANSDLIYIVADPSGVPASKKITVQNLLKTVNAQAIDDKAANAYTNAVSDATDLADNAYSNAISYLGNFTFTNNVITSTNSTVNVTIRASNVDLNMISNSYAQLHYNSNSAVARDYANGSTRAYVSSSGFFAEKLLANGVSQSLLSLETSGITLTTNSFAWNFGSNGAVTRGNSSTIYYNANSSNWANPAPTTIEEAINRLAVLVKTLNSGTGA